MLEYVYDVQYSKQNRETESQGKFVIVATWGVGFNSGHTNQCLLIQGRKSRVLVFGKDETLASLIAAVCAHFEVCQDMKPIEAVID